MMTSPQITPGPWQMFDRRPNIDDFEVSCGDSDVNGGLIIASCVGPDMEANAKAITAVPQMVEALQSWKCGACGGSGRYLDKGIRPGHPQANERGYVEELVQCKKCGGSGYDSRAVAALRTAGVIE